jgi:hypothetical protein
MVSTRGAEIVDGGRGRFQSRPEQRVRGSGTPEWRTSRISGFEVTPTTGEEVRGSAGVPMRPRLDTSFLLLEGRRALFLVHRAADGWLALDLAGPVTDRFAPGIEVVRGGDSFPDRILTL